MRRFVVESALSYLSNYNIDGFRIDNVDGILRYGNNGDGQERPNGRLFLREFNAALYEYKKNTFISFESHFYAGNNAKWLVAPIDSHKKALGATVYNESRLTYYLHKEFMPKSADDISPWKIQHIIDEKSWGKSESTVTDFHNHDAAAGLMPQRATGSYAYNAIALNKKSVHFHAIGKIKSMESIISFAFEGRTLDLIQSHILQNNSFEHDSTIQWGLLERNESSEVLAYKNAVNDLLQQKAFWPINLSNRKVLNIDEKSKTIVLYRGTDPEMKSGYLILINMSAFENNDFVIPSPKNTKFNLILNSDDSKFSGTGTSDITKSKTAIKTDLFKYFPFGINIEKISPYMTLVFKY